MYSTIVAFLKSLPLLVEAINQLGKLYHQIQIDLIEKRYEEMRREIADITHEIENGHHTNEKRKELIRRLNSAIRK